MELVYNNITQIIYLVHNFQNSLIIHKKTKELILYLIKTQLNFKSII